MTASTSGIRAGEMPPSEPPACACLSAQRLKAPSASGTRQREASSSGSTSPAGAPASSWAANHATMTSSSSAEKHSSRSVVRAQWWCALAAPCASRTSCCCALSAHDAITPSRRVNAAWRAAASGCAAAYARASCRASGSSPHLRRRSTRVRAWSAVSAPSLPDPPCARCTTSATSGRPRATSISMYLMGRAPCAFATSRSHARASASSSSLPDAWPCAPLPDAPAAGAEEGCPCGWAAGVLALSSRKAACQLASRGAGRLKVARKSSSRWRPSGVPSCSRPRSDR
mmetsp:Transcript_23264/g.59435  ORF Transcript_23264/g.59435 Transcript_23264/m.59435 type:complete len:286 (-) Transcript_23264:932-1789(-)